MGKAVERIALERGHSVQIISPRMDFSDALKDWDCAIEFTHASVAPEVIRTCIRQGIPVVSGTTGWDGVRPDIELYCREKNGTMLWSPNFSIGMHIVFEINKTLAALMNARPEYEVEILETHHTEKKDKPSGTAIALANQIIERLDRKTHWELRADDRPEAEALEVISERIPDVKGIHRVTYRGPYDIISLRHKALSRDAFALGAVLSAEWLTGKKGVFTFVDVIRDSQK